LFRNGSNDGGKSRKIREKVSKTVGTGRTTRKLQIQSKQRQIQFYKSYLEVLRRVTTDEMADGADKMGKG
jgi:hypothetical protein